ncbi:MAG: rRNA maturation RNase YbeY [Nitrospirae bacterium]|nr:rRNA maturation RNase YbeY [Nitrospirota bacterium]
MAVFVRNHLRRHRVTQAALRKVAQRILSEVGEQGALVSLSLVGDRRMRRLNRLYRGRDYPTDVLAFPMREAFLRLAPRAPRPAPELLGDVVISLPQAIRQAEGDGHSLDHELATLLIHGTLHLLGYDHERGGREAERMRRKERAIMRQVGPIPRLFRERSAVSRQRSAKNPRLKADR